MKKSDQDFTKKQKIDFIRTKLISDDKWAHRGMHRIYSFQTEDEKRTSEIIHKNGVGFSKADDILSDICRVGRKSEEMAESTRIMIRCKMAKYAGQLYRILLELGNEESLISNMKSNI